MDDLINRSALLAEYDRVHVGPPGGARKLMEEAPVVDAVRVQHRQWDRRRTFSTDVICSGCGTLQTTKDSQYKSRFCPGCGAKMDGERKTDA